MLLSTDNNTISAIPTDSPWLYINSRIINGKNLSILKKEKELGLYFTKKKKKTSYATFLNFLDMFVETIHLSICSYRSTKK